MWPVLVVMARVLLEQASGVPLVDDLAAEGADEAFRDRVGARRLDRRPDDLDVDGGEYGVEASGELAVAVADEEPEA